MSLGQQGDAVEDGSCGACGQKYKKGARVQWWDEVLCHVGCIEDDSEEQTTTVLVARNYDNRPVAVPQEVVIASERPYRAYLLHQAGHTWEQVALQENYPTWEAARTDVKRYLAEGAAAIKDFTRQELLEIELARYNFWTAALWEQTKKGSVPAINTSLSISAMRVKLLRLDQNIVDEKELEGNTVVVGSGDDDYQAGLEAAAEGKGHH